MDELISRLAAAIPGRTVLILGDVMLDEYIWGSVRRISPEAPVPVVESIQRSYTPGGAGNVAANVASLGGKAFLGGVTGDDQARMHLLRELAERGVKAELLALDDRPTTTKMRIVAHNQQIARVDTEMRLHLQPADENRLLAWVERTLPLVDVCVLSDYAKGVVTQQLAQRFIELAHRAGIPALVDPKGSDYKRYRGATLVTPNLSEAMQAAGFEINGHADLLAAARLLGQILGGSALLVTRGEEGMTLFVDGQEPFLIPAQALQVYDVTGAGDTAMAALALAIGAGATLPEAAWLANLSAGIVVGKFGTAAIALRELQDAIVQTIPFPASLPRTA